MGVIIKAKQMIAKRYYPWRIRRKSAQCGKGLYCGGKSWVTGNTYLGNYVSFNGMGISGNGKVVIGDYFHSGVGCQIITSFHNYEGNKIPYDETFLDKDVYIGDCVWLGNDVIILGGGENWRRGYYTGRVSCMQRYSPFWNRGGTSSNCI